MLVAFWQVQRLTREINDLQKEAMLITQRLSNHQKYAGRLGSSSILTMNNIAGLSPEILPRASLFAQYSDQASSMSAMQNLQMMKRIPIIAVSQQNRSVVEDGAVIDVSHIAQADRIGQDSTVVVGLSRKDDILSLHLLKSRDSVNNKTLYPKDKSYACCISCPVDPVVIQYPVRNASSRTYP